MAVLALPFFVEAVVVLKMSMKPPRASYGNCRCEYCGVEPHKRVI